MARKLTPAERLATAEKDLLLEEIADQSSWDQFLVEQAVFHFGQRHDEWSCNDLRDVLPELGHGFLGAAINSLRGAGIIAHTGRTVPSTQASTHGHRIGVWRITGKGRAIAAQRRIARARGRAA
ncbi:hypothetical protein [Streptomyces spectabilis]|uniref:MarR family transcriptional regulator n=1 Tax=Streptomyces spectabilis TaxID=68270 RepID=A0A5P2X4J6_STRST|nr:hypothetical protein [Streptomyces spectabilis]MBB5108379.1 hypothetical protein [Streptomyces spectabilis]MCI3901134.1 hypothetical protein [Streptomyces spectabilis]QEV58624.1 hypothetical protein CP982_07740 [Streptomyces spectabilis]GGV46178.1 hypothetical protein GCM10010245_72410 [Streptomyces spectabilis]